MIKGQLYLEWLKHRRRIFTTFFIFVLFGIGLSVVSFVAEVRSVSDFVRIYIYFWLNVLPVLVVLPLFIMLEKDLKDRHNWLYTQASLRQLLHVKVLFLVLVCTVFIVFLSMVGVSCELIVQNASLQSMLLPYVMLSITALFKVVVMQLLFLLIWSLSQAVTVYSQFLALFVNPVMYVLTMIVVYSDFFDLLQVGAVPLHISGIIMQSNSLSLYLLEDIYMGEMFAGVFIIALSLFLPASLLKKKVGD
ncbi:hypothetical protein QNH39_01520 [Neobacillus novalis]|uniref:Uncharacterized protein n=1 Tax=Neobacillus novalis TaxID=220687 RepID=A0AA95MSM9_9BACI|nr:hypothetical protein [Neobacillus novalis]WHY86601.1 hypothetical protein QNH39_01520 [Neobacillus novalis]